MIFFHLNYFFVERFQYGIGTQVMLSSTVHNPVREQILDKANKLLGSEDEVAALERKLADVMIKCL